MTCVICVVDHINTEAYCSVCCQLYIYVCHFVANKFVHQVKHLFWHYHCIVQASWHFCYCFCCDFIFTSYCCSKCDCCPTFFFCCEIEFWQFTCVFEQFCWNMIPSCTCRMCIFATCFYQCCVRTWCIVKYQCAFCRCSQFNCLS